MFLFIFIRELYLFSEFVSELSVLRRRFVLIRRHTSVNVNVSYRKTSSSRRLGRRGWKIQRLKRYVFE